MLPTQINSNQHLIAPASDSPRPAKPARPALLVALLSLLCVQASTAITILALIMAKSYYQFDATQDLQALALDYTSCSIDRYYHNYFKQAGGIHGQIYSIALIMAAVCVLFSLASLALTARAMHRSAQVHSTLPLSVDQLHLVMSRAMRNGLYICQSLSLLAALVVLGYYLPIFIDLQSSGTCVVATQQQKVYVIVLWVLAAFLVLVNLSTWAIGSTIAVMNREKDYLEAPEIRVTQPYDALHATQITQNNQPPNTNTFKPLQTEPNQARHTSNEIQLNPSNQSNTLKPNINYNNRYVSNQSSIYNKIEPAKEDQSKSNYSYGYNIENQHSNAGSRHLSPSKPEVYESPSGPGKRLPEASNRYYRGEARGASESSPSKEVRNEDINLELAKIEQRVQDLKKQKREPANLPEDDEQYLRTMNRYRQEQEERENRESPPRRILPESSRFNSPQAKLEYEGGGRLNPSQLKQEIRLKKRYETSAQRNKRKGILSEYIRDKYVDN